jgi:alkyl hydroperoxide reductase subunit AhpF
MKTKYVPYNISATLVAPECCRSPSHASDIFRHHTSSDDLLRSEVHKMNARTLAGRPAAFRVGKSRVSGRKSFAGKGLVHVQRECAATRSSTVRVYAVADGAKLDRKLRVAVVGGGPAGASAADDLAKGGVETYLFERKMDNCKVQSSAVL